MEKPMNKMEDMEMDKVSGGKSPKPIDISNANSMAANVDINKTQNVYGWKLP